GDPDVAEPRHRQILLRRAHGETLLVETADEARETAVLLRCLRGLVEGRPRRGIVPALLLFGRDTLQLGDAATALAGLREHLRELVHPEHERYDSPNRPDPFHRGVEPFRHGSHESLPGRRAPGRITATASGRC